MALGAKQASYFVKASIPANTATIVDYRIQVGATATTLPRAFVFGKGGLAKDFLGTVQFPEFFGQPEEPPYDLHLVVPFAAATTAEDQYLTVVDASEAGGPVTFTATQIKAAAVAEGATAHGTPVTAQDLAVLEAIPANVVTDIGGKVLSGNLTTATEVDIYKITVANNDRVQVGIAGEGEYDVVVSTDGTTDPQGDNAFGYVFSAAKGLVGSDIVTAPATTIYIAVLPYQARNGKYTLSVRKVAAP